MRPQGIYLRYRKILRNNSKNEQAKEVGEEINVIEYIEQRRNMKTIYLYVFHDTKSKLLTGFH